MWGFRDVQFLLYVFFKTFAAFLVVNASPIIYRWTNFSLFYYISNIIFSKFTVTLEAPFVQEIEPRATRHVNYERVGLLAEILVDYRVVYLLIVYILVKI